MTFVTRCTSHLTTNCRSGTRTCMSNFLLPWTQTYPGSTSALNKLPRLKQDIRPALLPAFQVDCMMIAVNWISSWLELYISMSFRQTCFTTLIVPMVGRIYASHPAWSVRPQTGSCWSPCVARAVNLAGPGWHPFYSTQSADYNKQVFCLIPGSGLFGTFA